MVWRLWRWQRRRQELRSWSCVRRRRARSAAPRGAGAGAYLPVGEFRLCCLISFARSGAGSHASESVLPLSYFRARRMIPSSSAASRALRIVFGSSNAASAQDRVEIEPPRWAMGAARACRAANRLLGLTPPGSRSRPSMCLRAVARSTSLIVVIRRLRYAHVDSVGAEREKFSWLLVLSRRGRCRRASSSAGSYRDTRQRSWPRKEAWGGDASRNRRHACSSVVPCSAAAIVTAGDQIHLRHARSPISAALLPRRLAAFQARRVVHCARARASASPNSRSDRLDWWGEWRRARRRGKRCMRLLAASCRGDDVNLAASSGWNVLSRTGDGRPRRWGAVSSLEVVRTVMDTPWRTAASVVMRRNCFVSTGGMAAMRCRWPVLPDARNSRGRPYPSHQARRESLAARPASGSILGGRSMSTPETPTVSVPATVVASGQSAIARCTSDSVLAVPTGELSAAMRTNGRRNKTESNSV